jgi:starch synthase
MPRRVLLLAPVLPADVIATAKVLEAADLLDALITRATTWPEFTRLLARATITQPFSLRPVSPVERNITHARWTADMAFYAVLALTRSRTRATDASFAFLDRFAQKRVNSSLGAIFAREDCCVRTFQRAKQNGVKTIYQLPTAYWRLVRELMEPEIEEFPGVCQAATDQREFGSDRTERKDAELKLADRVLCPSKFVRESLLKYRISNTECIPFGIDNASPTTTIIGRKPMFLYAGNITMRKGVHRILLAWKKLKAHQTHELRLIGDMFLFPQFLKDFSGMFTHVPRLSREELDRHYSEASAFVFNPVADGFGHVILEAMRSGVPVIASKNCGAPDTITDHAEGLLVDYGDQDQLTTALDWALSHPAELREMGAGAAERATKWTWNDYAQRFLAWLRPLIRYE